MSEASIGPARGPDERTAGTRQDGDWSLMFSAPVVVFGCGNTLFGDDGLAPLAVAELAAETLGLNGTDTPHAGHGAIRSGDGGLSVAFVDAGTSVRSLLADLLLSGHAPRRLVVVDVVLEPGREPGSLRELRLGPPVPDSPERAMSLHQAPTPFLLRAMRDRLGCEVCVLTVQAAHIPDHMEDGLSPQALAALPALKNAIIALCRAQEGNPI